MDQSNSQPTGGVYPVVDVSSVGVGVTLSELINNILFDSLGAQYGPAGRQRAFDYNLNASCDQVRTYLGTYFPRSLSESFLIFDSLLTDSSFAKQTAKSGCVSVCSVGTGTGGDLVGLLLALDKRLPTGTCVEVVSVEGNEEAHATMQSVLGLICGHLNSIENINVSLASYTFVPPEPFARPEDWLPGMPRSFNFVICSKMLNELHSHGVSSRPYYEFCDTFSGLIKPEGVLLVSDVTSRSAPAGGWIPKLLNGQINEFLSNVGEFKTILPLYCNVFEDKCDHTCYTKNTIRVTHRYVASEQAKICYRVIGHNDLARRLSGSPYLWRCPIVRDNSLQCDEYARLKSLGA